jgi:translation initiation factor 5B
MLERAREYAQLLCFDVPIDKDAEHLAEETGVKIFKADIIYHLFDSYKSNYLSILILIYHQNIWQN